MPPALPKACGQCGNATVGRCPCRKGSGDHQRGTAHERGYTGRWAVSRAAFIRKYPRCGDRPKGQRPVMSQCFEAGRVRAGYQVDHIVPHRGDRALFWDVEGNWQTLCRTCGAAKSGAGL